MSLLSLLETVERRLDEEVQWSGDRDTPVVDILAWVIQEIESEIDQESW